MRFVPDVRYPAQLAAAKVDGVHRGLFLVHESHTSRAERPVVTPDPAPLSVEDVRRYAANIRDETDGAALYRYLAAAERDERLRGIYERLAETEDRHRELWEARLRAAGLDVPVFRPSTRVRVLGWLARRFGPARVANIALRMEQSASATYDRQPEAVAAGLHRDERSHARIFREIAQTPTAGDVPPIANIEGRHRAASGNAIRAAVLGANDGLVSNLSLVMGVAGAGPDPNVVLLSGVAGLLAGSLSMALGEWISVRSSAEFVENQMRIERQELAEHPEEEYAELVLIYQAKGFSDADARAMADRVFGDPTTTLDVLAREELGIGEEETGSAWTAAVVSFLTFAVGALAPVFPWLFVEGSLAVVLSLVASGLGLPATGAIITLYTGRNLLFSAGRMLLFGLGAAAITYTIGAAIGVSTGI
jgi:VIT1/CCC1 family predicted Fe2+/Mn2+ transporter